MGFKYEVHAWIPDKVGGDEYRYILVYGGRYLIKALWHLYLWRKKCGVVKLEWR